eukprot:Plantae.Rhodophyta-Purpureofilum_apyrenoidigerum.ctg14382.p2 GENE.Plantae.Rhodophyta-Purpureofilum_apyrenoidigerum.ctg14382~~Plantae.Rhodophyta-Purpureofilum_apyrenoidigerum.ctg14382.p2  ORF type:complete len:374 (+),score=107.39 Plantae.Rhodophyta-Purpureofilum_apyrenoidigerum.ctg14382:44-1123(+)
MEVLVDSINHFDAGAAERLLTEYNSLLSEAIFNDAHILAALEETQEEGPNADVMLRRAQDHVRKLKTDFLELETKSRFLNVVADAGDRDSMDIPDEMLAETEISVALAKNKLKKIKGQSVQEKEKFKEAVFDMYQIYNAYNSAVSLARAKLQALSMLVEGRKAQSAVQTFVNTGNDSLLEECYAKLEEIDANALRAMLAAEEQKRTTMEDEISSLESSVRTLEEDNRATALRCEALTTEVTQLRKNVQDKEEKDAERVQLRETSTWHSQMHVMLENMTGVKILDAAPHAIVLLLRLPNSATYEAKLELCYSRTRVKRVHVTPGDITINNGGGTFLSLQDAVRETFVKIEALEGMHAPGK